MTALPHDMVDDLKHRFKAIIENRGYASFKSIVHRQFGLHGLVMAGIGSV